MEQFIVLLVCQVKITLIRDTNGFQLVYKVSKETEQKIQICTFTK